MGYEKREFGRTTGGETAYCYTLVNENHVRATFTDLGAVWVSMELPGEDGAVTDVVLGYDQAENYCRETKFLGAVVGRYANRIGGARFELNGKTYQLAATSGPNNLHSGPDFYKNRIWETQIEETELGTEVIFSLKSPDGDQGFPGNAEISVSYTLTADNSVVISYHMISDQDTVANLTNHSYFNLAGHASSSVLDHVVWINADRFTPADETSVPTGELAAVAGTPMDFTSPKTIGAEIGADYQPLIWGRGYDHNWVLNGFDGTVRLSATLEDPASGRKMEVYTDRPGVQFYTANYLENQFPGKEGAVYGPRCACCFETQHFPDAVNRPEFPSPVLKAGEELRTTTVYRFLF